MCGIVGGIGNGIGRVLLNGLRRLEYRGYDSAGIALAKNGGIKRLVVAGRVSQLRRAARGLKRHYRHRPYALGDARRAE